ncbi:hypothetical protein RCH09_000721 [Actimicrobium sp. GrIS 1.19]|nr:hypothetical protein [Actimicrobium sp. GrIS 1.19]
MPPMPISYPSDAEQLRAEIAAAAARMIAEDGADFGSAKRRAVKQILGNRKLRGDVMPDNAQVEAEVRIYNELFFGDTQPARLLALRQLALQLMTELAPFAPYLVGAVLNGTAGAHSDIRLHLFAESAKDVEIYLLNKNIDFEVSEGARTNPKGDPVEVLSFMWQGEGVHLSLHAPDDVRGNSGKTERADVNALRRLLEEDAG